MMVRFYWNPLGNNEFEYFIYDNLSGEKVVVADYEQILKFTYKFYGHDQTKAIQDYYSMSINHVVVFT